MNSTDSVIIAGGGVGGISTAIALAKKGIKSVVLEKSLNPEVDRGDVLHQTIIDLFKKWDIYKNLEKQNILKFSNFKILDNNGKQIFNFNLNTDISPPANFTVLKHPKIRIFLEEMALSTGLVAIKKGERCIELLKENDRVVGVKTANDTYYSNLTVIAAGFNTPLSKDFGEVNMYTYPVSFYNGCFKLIDSFSGSGSYVVGEQGIMIILPLPNGEMRIGLQFEGSIKVSESNIKSIIRKRLSIIKEEDLELLNGHVYTLNNSCYNNWYIQGAVLVGDSAHTVHPAGGQGMNLAMKDADCLAESISLEVLKDIDKLDYKLTKYSSQRIKEVRTVQRRTHFMGQMAANKSNLIAKVRQQALILSNNIPMLKRAIFNRIINVK